jgi:hypothetical protein
MIKFFRKIRQNLLMENKTGKYFKYAIGEIILVVIGILIALSINNWNQRQQNEELSKLYFEDFINEVSSDITALNGHINSNERMNKNLSSIINTLSTKKELSESELTLFFKQNRSLGFESYFLPETSTFRQLEANGDGNLIKDKGLRDILYEYYTLNERNGKNNEISVQLYQHNLVTPNIMKNILTGDFLQSNIGSTLNRSKLDLESLRQNSDYLMALFSKKEMCDGQNRRYERIKLKAEELLQLLESK